MSMSVASLNPAKPVFFERVLWPHRSLPPRGFRLLMLGLGVLSLVAGICFVAAGAWPVCGFFGLDVALLYLAFRLSYRSARQRETLRLADDQFTVERVDIYGMRRLWRFQPFWLRVVLEERRDESNRLLLASHGKSIVIGDFLAPPVRRDLAATLRDVLSRWRAALNPANAPK
jgi:uncharacterized membrane protein